VAGILFDLTLKRRQQQSLGEPPVREDPEMSFPARVRTGVDTLFTYQVIKENLQERAEDSDTTSFVQTLKQKKRALG
jgi:hypothetical protein